MKNLLDNGNNQSTPKILIGIIIGLLFLGAGFFLKKYSSISSVKPHPITIDNLSSFEVDGNKKNQIKFAGESITGQCNKAILKNNSPKCNDGSYECFFSFLMDGPCTMTVDGVDCGNAKQIIGDNLCHRKCDGDIDCSEGYYCGSISGYVGDVREHLNMCFKK